MNDATATAAVEQHKPYEVVLTETTYGFRKSKETGIKRPSIKLKLPYLTLNGLADILTVGGKDTELMLDTVNDVIYNAGKAQVGEDSFVPENLDLSKLDWHYIANMPKAARQGSNISDEAWEAFGKDYLEIMPALSGRNAEKTANACQLFIKKLNPCKTRKDVLTFLQGQLAMWFNNSTNQEEFSPIYEFLDDRIKTFLLNDDSKLIENL